MKVISATGGVASTNAYLIADESAGEAVLFDAPDHTIAPLLDEADKEKWRIVGLWLTHGHFDHIADHAELTRRFPEAQVMIHRLDEPKLKHPRAFPGIVIPPRKADLYVEDGQKLRIGSIDLEVIHTPGHSPGHVSYHFPHEKILIGGDLIIMGAVGRTDLPDSDPAQLNVSLRRIMALDDQTQLLGGHGQPSLLADERRGNVYVQMALKD
jgi:glyoxylase-like metal-dependent hydrolase (beta-lactamase superfamily II)